MNEDNDRDDTHTRGRCKQARTNLSAFSKHSNNSFDDRYHRTIDIVCRTIKGRRRIFADCWWWWLRGRGQSICHIIRSSAYEEDFLMVNLVDCTRSHSTFLSLIHRLIQKLHFLDEHIQRWVTNNTTNDEKLFIFQVYFLLWKRDFEEIQKTLLPFLPKRSEI